MSKVCGRIFIIAIKLSYFLMSKIVLNQLSAFHKILFRKLVKDLKRFIKLDTDIKFSIFIILMSYTQQSHAHMDELRQQHESVLCRGHTVL